MIRTKSYMLREIKQLEKRKKKLQIELSVLKKTGGEVLQLTGKIIEKELIKINCWIEAHTWTALTSEKDLPKIKTKKNKKKPNEK